MVMEDSILISTKKILGLGESYTPFDPDITTHINATFSTINQLGVGPEAGFFITDESEGWSDLTVSPQILNMLKTYMFLKVRSLFDPPQTGYLVEAMEKQIAEYEWRLSTFRETDLIEEESA